MNNVSVTLPSLYRLFAVVVLGFIHIPSLQASSLNATVAPMIVRLDRADLSRRDLVVTTEVRITNPTTVKLELVEPHQLSSGLVEWRPTTEPSRFKLPFRERYLEVGRHTLQFEANESAARVTDPFIFAVAVTTEKKQRRDTGARGVVVIADVQLKQIFQITYPGLYRGARRYRATLDREATESNGILTIGITNEAKAPFYAEAEVRLTKAGGGNRIGSFQPLFLKTEGPDGMLAARSGRFPIYPGSRIEMMADVTAFEPGEYRLTIRSTFSDGTGSQRVIKSASFKKTSAPSVAGASQMKRLSSRSKSSVRAERFAGGIAIHVSGPDVRGLVRVQVEDGDPERCRPAIPKVLASASKSARVLLPDVEAQTCRLVILTKGPPLRIQVKNGKVTLVDDTRDSPPAKSVRDPEIRKTEGGE